MSGIALGVAYVAAAGVRTGGTSRRVRRNSWFGLAVPLDVVALANPGTANLVTPPKKYWLRVRPCDRLARFAGWARLDRMLAASWSTQPKLADWVVTN